MTTVDMEIIVMTTIVRGNHAIISSSLSLSCHVQAAAVSKNGFMKQYFGEFLG